MNNNPLRYTDPTGHMYLDNECGYQGQDCGDSIFNSGGSNGGGSSGNGGGVGIGENNAGLSGSSGTGCNTVTNTNTNGEYCHDYSSPPTVVCAAQYACTEAQMQAYLTQFQYPGQLPWDPVQDGGSYVVFPFNTAPLLTYLNPGLYALSVALNDILSPYGAITVDISPDGLTGTNFTEPTHIFHEGKVDRTLSQLPDGSWVITSHGTGTNTSNVIANVNQQIGPVIFQFMDTMMTTYVGIDQLTGLLP